jgi:hypothetical protein
MNFLKANGYITSKFKVFLIAYIQENTDIVNKLIYIIYASRFVHIIRL